MNFLRSVAMTPNDFKPEYMWVKAVLVFLIGATGFLITTPLPPTWIHWKLIIGALNYGAVALLAYLLKPPTSGDQKNSSSDDKKAGDA